MRFLIASLLLLSVVGSVYSLEYACVDTERIVRESKFIAQAQEELKKEVEAYQKKIAQKQRELEKLRKELENKVLSESARKRKMRQLEKLEDELRILQLEAQSKLTDKKTKLEKMVYDKVLEAVRRVARREKLQAVFDCAAFLYKDKSIDITPKVIRVLDRTAARKK